MTPLPMKRMTEDSGIEASCQAKQTMVDKSPGNTFQARNKPRIDGSWCAVSSSAMLSSFDHVLN
jgi:hypothetical protein